MGANTSNLPPEEVAEIAERSNFTRDEISRLWKRFQRLDKDHTGSITMEEFLSIPELAMNPLVMRIISLFDNKSEDRVGFTQFVDTLSIFHVKGSRLAKLKCAFRVYDIDNDGFISHQDLFETLQMMVGNNLTDEQLSLIVEKTISEADQDNDGRISFNEFCDTIGDVDVVSKMSIRF